MFLVYMGGFNIINFFVLFKDAEKTLLNFLKFANLPIIHVLVLYSEEKKIIK